MKQSEMLGRLVENAIGFLSHSIEALETAPKFSVIDFYAAVELFLKARLLREHWSLVVAKNPDWERFLAGDFVSVSFDEACTRLDKVVRSSIPSRARDKFDAVRLHRNKMVHFFHAGEDSQHRVIEDIAIEQLHAWYELHQLLLQQWKEVFEPWQKELAGIERQLQSHKKYLAARFDALKPKLDEIAAGGQSVCSCTFCNFAAAVMVAGDISGLHDGNCLVCGAANMWLSMECPDCGKNAILYDGCDFSCECGYSPDERGLVEALDETVVTKDNYFDNPYPANCGECEGWHTVVSREGKNFCVVCLDVADELSYCGFCAEASTGSLEDSYLVGCGQCDGSAGWHARKDD
ncbi:hypothetical protein [Bradyrhizobium liaoningense]|uniref:hypothetical protein n=1 Tax=Bradyrhizobium liaoningense TaxID=43992 RepID=UPI001BAD1D08|nr:hypothetical protein [Bradyrhizobium liaoningense]MBR1169147.1 hypothetical protein [Bradyrhizobium liaoningense]